MVNLKQYCGKGFQKALAVLTLLSMFISFGAVTASAAGTAKITVSSCTVERGASASVAFNLEENPGIWGIKLRIHYDHSVLTLKSVTSGSVFEKSELTLSQDLNKDPYVVVASGNSLENKTANGAIVTLNFTVTSNAAFKAYPITVEVSQANNVDGNKISVNSVDGSVTVVNCTHSDKEWRVTEAANCEESGKETLTCKKCGETFETRVVNATGHQHTEVRNAVAATKTSEGYTGDTYCKDCGKLIIKGKAIAKLKSDTSVTNPPANNSSATNPPKNNSSSSNPSDTTADTESSTANVPIITGGKKSVFNKDSNEPLVFVSDADFSEFIRVEIDGEILGENDFTAESGSTVIIVNADYLNKLSYGEHTVSIVSKSGTATTQFTVRDASDTTGTDATNPPEIDSADTGAKSSATLIIIAVLIIALLVGIAAVLFVIQKRRG